MRQPHAICACSAPGSERASDWIGTERIEQHEETDKLINNRQAGRRRGRGGQRSPNNPGRPEQGNRIDNRARGNAPQLLEKYKTLARDAQMQGDRVNTEYYLQFADHYFRVLNESRARFEDQNQNQPRRQRDDNDGDDFDGDDMRTDDRFDTDDGDQQPQRQQQQPQQQQRPRYEDRGNRDDQPRRQRQDAALVEPRDEPVMNGGNGGHVSQDEDEQPAPRRGRPRRQPQPEAAEAFDATILPPALSATVDVVDVDGGDEPPAPRRRGRPRRTEADPAQA
jgi:hypothetical protein